MPLTAQASGRVSKGDKIMLRRLTIPEVICAGVLCMFAMGSVNATSTAERDRKNEYKAAVARADADYKAAKDACKPKQGNDRDVCLKEAKAEHVKVTADAKARLKSKDAVADAREDTMVAQYKVAKEKCDALSGDAKDKCVKDAKLRYHQ
jgi:regulator of protease activity HflC (stomatin/prohibitin superfamily)